MSEQDRIPFQIAELELNPTPIPVGKYVASIDEAKFAIMPDGEQKLWVGCRITGPTQANRYITTLMTLDDKAASAYKTASFIKAIAGQLGEAYLPADVASLVGYRVGLDITQWTPRTTGVPTAEIRSFLVAPAEAQPNRVEQVVAQLAEGWNMNTKLSGATDPTGELPF